MNHRHPSPGQFARRALAQVVLFLLSLGYLFTTTILIVFGYVVGWANDPGRPVIGIAMILAGITVIILGPRTIKRITGRDPIDPPPTM